MTDVDDLLLEQLVYADSAEVAWLTLHGHTAEADAYASKPDVAARIRRWKDSKR